MSSDRDALIEAMADAIDLAVDVRGDAGKAATAAIAAIEAAGVRLGPVEATEGMITAAMTRPRRRFNKTRDMYADFYAWMIAASPYAPGETVDE